MQKDIMQIRRNPKRQNTNVTKYKKTIHKYDKTQKDKIQMRQNTNMTKHKCDKTTI